ncbi:MAG TPA: acyl transferase [Luteibaculaceae bacterium]|nr:acyl transferase [Luteibaculaceae bacterium]
MVSLPNFFSIKEQLKENPAAFESIALQIFAYQYLNNPVYHRFCQLLAKHPGNVLHTADIPYLPIHLFKSQEICCFEPVWAERIYTSSATGGTPSRHFVRKYSDYYFSFSEAFRLFYGHPSEYCILALLPSYLDRDGSSLIEMVDVLIKESGHAHSGFYLKNTRELIENIDRVKRTGQKILLIGVSFALLDLAEQGPFGWEGVCVMETGGMKGRRKEITRRELHDILNRSFNTQQIHSEYGMTELLSQAYSSGDGFFFCPPWMRISIREANDPFSPAEMGKTGGINVIDLANIESCSFIATQDLGKIHENGGFEVVGRFDHSDVRGCNLMVE